MTGESGRHWGKFEYTIKKAGLRSCFFLALFSFGRVYCSYCGSPVYLTEKLRTNNKQMMPRD